MSTRGHIAIKENRKYKYIYNHHDSYIDGLGITHTSHTKNRHIIGSYATLGI